MSGVGGEEALRLTWLYWGRALSDGVGVMAPAGASGGEM